MRFALVPKDHRVIGAWIIGALLGGFLGYHDVTGFLNLTREYYEPLPHQIAKYEGGISLRFAMVHDVIHERFEKHGEAYYRERNRVVSEELEKIAGGTPAPQLVERNAGGTAATQLLATPPATGPVDRRWRLMDDLAVGHVHLGEFDRAIAVMRDKLARQEKVGVVGAELYSTYANLGTAMMIDAIVKSAGGKESALELKESLTWVRKSIAVNPEAHFGREVWQVVLGEFLLAVGKEPKLLMAYDFIGDSVSEKSDSQVGLMRYVGKRMGKATRAFLERGSLAQQERAIARDWIPKIRTIENWEKPADFSSFAHVPFDEPVLGIVGMWRYGGGANPFFSLALAEIMRNVGQSHIAWAAYERTTMLLSGLPYKDEAEFLTEYCRTIQRKIEANLNEESATLRAAFNADLKAGLEYQAAYQKYEAERIAKGDSIDDPHFYDAFLKEHGLIASEAGNADSIRLITDDFATRVLAPAILLGGLCALGTGAIRQRARADAAPMPEATV